MRRETPEQRRRRVAIIRAEMTLNAWDRSVLESRMHEYRREHGRGFTLGMASVFLKHFYGTGPKAQALRRFEKLVPPPNPFWATLKPEAA